MFFIFTHVNTSGELILVGGWVSPHSVSPQKPLRNEHRPCWVPPGEPQPARRLGAGGQVRATWVDSREETAPLLWGRQ